jgi:hypothetical protein
MGADRLADLLSMVRVTDDEDELNSCSFAVCVPAELEMPFTDNLLGVCTQCGRMVQFRPSMPSRPPKICLPCFELRITKKLAH